MACLNLSPAELGLTANTFVLKNLLLSHIKLFLQQSTYSIVLWLDFNIKLASASESYENIQSSGLVFSLFCDATLAQMSPFSTLPQPSTAFMVKLWTKGQCVIGPFQVTSSQWSQQGNLFTSPTKLDPDPCKPKSCLQSSQYQLCVYSFTVHIWLSIM